MSSIDLQKMALRLKVVEMIKLHARQKLMDNAYVYWRRLIQVN